MRLTWHSEWVTSRAPWGHRDLLVSRQRNPSPLPPRAPRPPPPCPPGSPGSAALPRALDLGLNHRVPLLATSVSPSLEQEW